MMVYAKAVVVLSLLGTLNALYLTLHFVQNTWGTAVKSFCDLSEQASCSAVIVSPFALFLGVPVCTVALMVYPVLVVLGVMALRKPRTRDLFFVASVLAGMGLMLNSVYVYNEFAHIHAYCPLCIVCTFLIAGVLYSAVRGYFASVQ
jgi:uncharacterized membrane protein